MMMEKGSAAPTRDDYLQQELAQQLNLPSLAPNAAGLPPRPPELPEGGGQGEASLKVNKTIIIFTRCIKYCFAVYSVQ